MKNLRKLEGSDGFISLRVKARADLYIFTSYPYIPWKVLAHTENLVKSACEVGPLTNVCKKQNFSE